MKKNRKVSYQNRIKFVSGSQDRINEGGLILSKYDGIIKASGLQNAKLGELVFVVMKTGSKISKIFGLTFNLTKTEAGIMFFGSTK